MESERVKNREDFILFLQNLSKNFEVDFKQNKNKITGGNSEWAHWYVGDFLGAIAAWLEDSEKYKKNSLSWKDLASIVESGKIYE